MDSSSRLSFVLGELRVPASELQAKEWLKIVQKVLEICKPYLKYLPRFEPIDKLLNCSRGDYDDRQTDESIMEFPEGIDKKTRCLVVTSISRDISEESLLTPGYGTRFVTERNLLLSQKEDWLLWEFKYERTVRHGLGYRAHRTGIREIGQICEFSLIDEDKLLTLLEIRPDLGNKILRSLHISASEGVRERKMRLQGVKQIENLLAGMINRIS